MESLGFLSTLRVGILSGEKGRLCDVVSSRSKRRMICRASAIPQESTSKASQEPTPQASQDFSSKATPAEPNEYKVVNRLSESGLNGFGLGTHRMKLYAGSSNPELAEQVAKYIGKVAPSPIMRKKFADGELYVKLEDSVRGCNVFLIQSTSNPGNDNIMELLLMIDACRRAHASQVNVVLPYYGYARADRLIDPDQKRREALTSKLVSNMITEAGADRIVVVDIHSPQTCGFFDIPLDHIYGSPVLVDYIKRKKYDDVVVVAPDVGGVARARAFAKALDDAPLAIIDKRREAHNVAKVLNLVGDVQGKRAIVVDDMIDTAGTICECGKVLRENGAHDVIAVATHAVLSGPAVERLSTGVFSEVIVSNSILLPPEKKFPQLTVLSIAPLIGETIWRLNEQSFS